VNEKIDSRIPGNENGWPGMNALLATLEVTGLRTSLVVISEIVFSNRYCPETERHKMVYVTLHKVTATCNVSSANLKQIALSPRQTVIIKTSSDGHISSQIAKLNQLQERFKSQRPKFKPNPNCSN